MQTSPPVKLSDFAAAVKVGLNAYPRHLSSKWFYDERGDELFQAIMQSPEYYLTDCEREIFQHCADDLLAVIGNRPFDLIELGAGDGSKTTLLIERFIAAGADFAYRPVDISAHALKELEKLIYLRWPKLEFQPVEADYFRALDRLGNSSEDRLRLVLFPGGNVGNFRPGEAVEMLTRIRSYLGEGDLLFTGFDLKKDPDLILAAYNDAGGHTAAFNLNLLTRINRELTADFPLDAWRHWETYDPVSGAARSYLVATRAHAVTVEKLKQSFEFSAWETISVEISQKYNRRQIEGMAEASGFTFLKHLEDSRGWFVDSLWRAG